ncbi:MAG TPA: transaldolase [Marmoricola sp.]|nr:transaldolase [Marmoricola sp.]
MTSTLQQLSDIGVSIWLDDLSRERLETGNLAELVADSAVVGVTTNPAIFQGAISNGERYDEQLRGLVAQGLDVNAVVEELTTTDVRNACDVLHPVYEATDGVDGRVSIEVTPDLAADAAGTVAQATALWAKVERDNLFIKIPGTPEGCQAISETLAAGISVNVTLIFGLDQYNEVMQAYIDGLERAAANGHDLSTIHSVASFFISRVDTEIDKRLGDDSSLAGKAGIANARLAFQAFEEFFSGPRWDALAAQGARLQRPLWASTGVKNPDYDDTMYVIDLAVDGTVNTMPEKTMDAVRDHGAVKGDQVHGHYDEAAAILAELKDAGIDYDDVIELLICEGVEKFVVAWDDVLKTVSGRMDEARG